MHTCILALALLVAILGRMALAEPVKTSKERLSDKASDEQRIDNCHVAPERRGPVARPDCPQAPGPAPAGGSPTPR